MASSSRKASKKAKVSPNFPLNYFWNAENKSSFLDGQTIKRVLHGDCYHIGAGNERSIEHGMVVDANFLIGEGFANVVSLFRFQNWIEFISDSNDFQPTLIKLFYHNIMPIGNSENTDSFKSKVYGKVVNISPRSIKTHLFEDEEVDGVVLNGMNFASCYPGYTLGMGIESLLEPNCVNRMSKKSVDMTIENRLLFHIITHVVTPRSGSYSEATNFDIGLMFLIKNHIKIHLPSLMIYHMRKVFKNPNMSLVYPVFLTVYLIDSCGTQSVESEGVSMTKFYYDKNALKLLFTYDSNTKTWVKKYGQRNTIEEEEAPQDEYDQFDVPHHDSPGNPNTFILDSLSRIEDNQMGLRQEVDRVHYRMDGMERSLEEIQELLRNMGGGASGPSYNYFHQ